LTYAVACTTNMPMNAVDKSINRLRSKMMPLERCSKLRQRCRIVNYDRRMFRVLAAGSLLINLLWHSRSRLDCNKSKKNFRESWILRVGYVHRDFWQPDTGTPDFHRF